MAHFARVENGKVTNVIVAEQAHINTLPDKDKWIQTSYNTHQGKHTLDGTPLRGNFAGIGYTYNAEDDYFAPPRPIDIYDKECSSWTFNKTTYSWDPPIEYPEPVSTETSNKLFYWDESARKWIAFLDTNTY